MEDWDPWGTPVKRHLIVPSGPVPVVSSRGGSGSPQGLGSPLNDTRYRVIHRVKQKWEGGGGSFSHLTDEGLRDRGQRLLTTDRDSQRLWARVGPKESRGVLG